MGSKPRFAHISLVIILASVASGLVMHEGNAQSASSYFYRFNVDRDGFTAVEIYFNSTEVSGESWVFVPKNESDWSLLVAPPGQIQWHTVETDEVSDGSYYFYRALKFSFQSNGFFNMTIKFDFKNGALVMEPRGMFYSPQIGFKAGCKGKAEVLFNNDFQINERLAVVVGSRPQPYPAQDIKFNKVLFNLEENVVRLQVEFGIDAPAEITTLRSSDNRTFKFETASRYETYANNILNFYSRIYNKTSRLFNVTLEDVAVQWFLPDFESLLSVGGFVPLFTGGLGPININIVFIRTVSGTIEDIAAHELVHRFLGKAGIPPNEFLWFHEGLAQYVSITLIFDMGYEVAETEKANLESSAESLIQRLGGEDFSSIGLQHWSPSYQPLDVDVSWLYAASYYVISQLPQVVRRDGFEYYQSFFELMGTLPYIDTYNTAKIRDIRELALYLGQAVNASVASTLNRRWGFTVSDLSQLKDLITEARKAVSGVNPIFQPYRSLADYLYQQALLSAEAGDWSKAESLLQLSITVANLAPLLTFLTIAAILALLSYALVRRSRRPRLVVPPPPPEILGSSG